MSHLSYSFSSGYRDETYASVGRAVLNKSVLSTKKCKKRIFLYLKGLTNLITKRKILFSDAVESVITCSDDHAHIVVRIVSALQNFFFCNLSVRQIESKKDICIV